MTFDEAIKIAKNNPGQGIREKRMQARWKIVWIKWPKSRGGTPAGGALFCINPITGADYEYRPSGAEKTSINWSLI